MVAPQVAAAGIGAASNLGVAALGGAGGGAPPHMNSFNDRSIISIGGGSGNVGEILKNFWGPSQNGGFEGPTPNRFPSGRAFWEAGATPIEQAGGDFLPAASGPRDGSDIPWTMLALGLGGALVVYQLVR